MRIKYRLILSHSTILILMLVMLVMLVFTGIRFNSTASKVRDILKGMYYVRSWRAKLIFKPKVSLRACCYYLF